MLEWFSAVIGAIIGAIAGLWFGLRRKLPILMKLAGETFKALEDGRVEFWELVQILIELYAQTEDLKAKAVAEDVIEHLMRHYGIRKEELKVEGLL